MTRAQTAWGPLLAGIGPLAAALVLLAALGPNDLGPGLLVVAVAVAGSALLRGFAPGAGPLVALLPILGGLAFLGVTVPTTTAAEAVAGLAGVGVLLWIGRSDVEPAPLRSVLSGVLVPALGFGIALGISLLLPVARQSVGVAAVLLSVALGVVAWVVLAAAPAPRTDTTLPPSL